MAFNEDDTLYMRVISLLEDIKLTQGPTAVTSTIKRHPLLREFLLAYQKSFLSCLERDISSLTSDD